MTDQPGCPCSICDKEKKDTLRIRIAKLLASTVCTSTDTNLCAECLEPELSVADAIIKEIAAFRSEVSEDEFLDVMIEEEKYPDE